MKRIDLDDLLSCVWCDTSCVVFSPSSPQKSNVFSICPQISSPKFSLATRSYQNHPNAITRLESGISVASDFGFWIQIASSTLVVMRLFIGLYCKGRSRYVNEGVLVGVGVPGSEVGLG